MPISENLDMLSCELMGEALDRLAAGEGLSVVASIMNASEVRLTCEFDDDSAEECLEAAHEWVQSRGTSHTAKVEMAAKTQQTASASGQSLPDAAYYAIAYLGAISEGNTLDESSYQDALILEFGEEGTSCGYSAYSLIENIGNKEAFRWSEPAPAGELPLLF